MLTCKGPIWTNNVIIPQSQVLTDIANAQLTQVTLIIPDGKNSDHALANDGSGPPWVASIVNAIGNSAYWGDTAIIITWDDWGGWYDHVAPRIIDDDLSRGSGYVYGFRVPLIDVSPYANLHFPRHARPRQHPEVSRKTIGPRFAVGRSASRAPNLTSTHRPTQFGWGWLKMEFCVQVHCGEHVLGRIG